MASLFSANRLAWWCFGSLMAAMLLMSCAGPADQTHAPDAPRKEPALVEALAVLTRWDERREIAYRREDPGLLMQLYEPGSTAGERDLAILRSFLQAEATVRALRFQRVRARLIKRSENRFVVEVEERLNHVVVHQGRRTRRLPGSSVEVRRIWFERADLGWVVTRVRAPVRSVGPEPDS